MAVECQAGQATVNLQLDLGLPHGHPQEPPQQKRVGPSRLRRRARREQARSEAAVDAVQATAAEDVAEKQTNDKAAPVPTPTGVAVQDAPQVTEATVQAAVHQGNYCFICKCIFNALKPPITQMLAAYCWCK